MPPVTILSPYSGRPVKVREQDLGRAVRDEQGRVFYIVEDPDHGRYAARTRKGSDKDLQRYRDMQAKVGKLDDDPATQAARHATVYDATGTKRRNPVGLLVLLILVLALAAAAYVVVTNPGLVGLDTGDDPDPATQPSDPQSSVSPAVQPVFRAVAVSGAPRYADPQPQALLNIDAQPKPANQSTRDASSKTQPKPQATERTPAASTSTDERDSKAAVEPDPRPVIVPTRAWRPEAERFVFVKAEPDRSYKDFRHTATGLRYKITHHTDGPTAKAGNFVSIRYTAQTLDGEPLIDDARQSFVLMSGEAIRAFDEGLAGIRAGEQLRMLVPRGHSAAGRLPGIERVPDEPFLLDVQLLTVRPGVTFVVEEQGNIERNIAGPGDAVRVHYVTWVEGRSDVIDSTSVRGEPLAFTLGQGEVIPGLDLGLTGMRVGETRLLTIPPYLAYGENSVAGGLIPENAVLSFRVLLVGIDEPQQP